MNQNPNPDSDLVAAHESTGDVISEGPWLWNPDVAALLSWLIFSSAFGAAVHAANWQRLGEPRRMWASLAWVVLLPVSCLSAAVFGAVIGSAEDAYKLVVAAWYLNVIVWYFLSGRKQSKYLVFKLRNKYRRESWFVPIVVVLLILSTPALFKFFA
jgi:hypothetical protein